MTALSIRRDRTSVVLRKAAKAEKDPRAARRMLAIANALDGMSRADAARAAGMDRQALRDCVVRYNEEGLEGLYDRSRPGRPPRLSPEEQASLIEIVLAGPDPEANGLSAYTLEDLAAICKKRFKTTLHPNSISRILKKHGLSRQKTRPLHPLHDPAAAAAFKKSPAHLEARCSCT